MPPDSLLRAADESALRTIQQEINHRLFVWVKQWRCVDPNRLAGIALNPVSDDEARAFVAAHVLELREQPGALPDRL